MKVHIKKCLLSLCLTVTATAILALPATAAEVTDTSDYSSLPHVGEIGPEFDPSDTYQNVDVDDELLAAGSPDAVAEILHDRYIDRISAMTVEELAAKKAKAESTLSTFADDEKDYVVSATTVLTTFCLNDGISLAEIYTAWDTSNEAADLAEDKYGDGGGYQDSYRHFVWNHMMTDSMGQYDARTIACNYEWQAVVLPYAEDVYYDAVEEYILMPGVSAVTAAVLAYDDAMEYAVELRDIWISMSEGDFSVFQELFNVAAVRDFWNNCYGRAYADDYSYSYDTAFSVALANDELINNDEDVTYSQTYDVWNWDWFTP